MKKLGGSTFIKVPFKVLNDEKFPFNPEENELLFRVGSSRGKRCIIVEK